MHGSGAVSCSCSLLIPEAGSHPALLFLQSGQVSRHSERIAPSTVHRANHPLESMPRARKCHGLKRPGQDSDRCDSTSSRHVDQSALRLLLTSFGAVTLTSFGSSPDLLIQ